MDLNEKYFSNNTRGYKIINRFYLKYRDLFIKTIFTEFEDFRNQIFLNISGIKLSEEIKNEEAYIIGSIKIQCRVQLDKALRRKKEKPESQFNNSLIEEDGISITENLADSLPDPHEMLEGEEVFNSLNTFKLQLNTVEKELLNNMIEEKTRIEIAEAKNLNMNTLDTHIRRLRIKLFTFLKENGYEYKMFKKYEKSE
jgi:DNA-directed RNA polymerase specialized sigma24 family protein